MAICVELMQTSVLDKLGQWHRVGSCHVHGYMRNIYYPAGCNDFHRLNKKPQIGTFIIADWKICKLFSDDSAFVVSND